MDQTVSDSDEKKWYVMRDLKRPNAKLPAYLSLAQLGFEVFTPMHTVITEKNGKKVRRRCPVVGDLLFVHDSRPRIEHVVRRTPTLQFRFKRGGKQFEALTVGDREMTEFIDVVTREDSNPVYLSPAEISPEMIGREIRIIGGPFDGRSGNLLALRGSRKKRLLVNLPGIIAASVLVDPEYIEYIG